MFVHFFSSLMATLKHLVRTKRQRQWQPMQYTTQGLNLDPLNVTLRYPSEQLEVPGNGRYKLNNAIEDCIVCDKCAKACPVDCIDIESIKSKTLLGRTRSGHPKILHAAKFDIDMGKCCFCGLCTVVCPTECLTMQPEYDFSTDNIQNHIVSFAKMRPEDIKTALENQ